MPISFPTLSGTDVSRDFLEQFLGYNHTIRTADGEFYEMQNMTADYYPVLATRKKRGIVKQTEKPQGLFCKDALCYIDNNHLYINGNEIEPFMQVSGGNNCEYQLVGMGAYLLVFSKLKNGLQNGWYINTENTSEHGFIDKVNEITPNNSVYITYNMCGKNGVEYNFSDNTSENYVYVSNVAPQNPKNGDKWLDTSGTTHYLKIYAATTSMWATVSTTYVKISYPNIGIGFKSGDAVSISGLECSSAKYGEKANEQIKILNTNMIIQSIDEESETPQWIVVTGILDKICIQNTGKAVFSRQAPYMDFICECNNRLWGCRYGSNRNGETVNEIYACKQGDFKNWFCYAGISTDSYAASVGSDGVWTGCVHYGSYVLFFKENCIHKMYGTMPSNYQLIEQKVRGLQRGSEKSLCIVNETLFYKSASDICYYDGSLPVGISNNLGEESYSNAVAGSIGNKYYISMQDSKNNWHMFVYDIAKSMWHREDNTRVSEFCRDGSNLYFINADTNELMNICGGINTEKDFKWYAQTGAIGYSYPDNKYIGRILIRLSKPISSEVRIYISYDDQTENELVASLNGGGIRSFSIPIMPRRCDHFSVRFEGCGECKIYSISKTLELGSDS